MMTLSPRHSGRSLTRSSGLDRAGAPYFLLIFLSVHPQLCPNRGANANSRGALRPMHARAKISAQHPFNPINNCSLRLGFISLVCTAHGPSRCEDNFTEVGRGDRKSLAIPANRRGGQAILLSKTKCTLNPRRMVRLEAPYVCESPLHQREINELRSPAVVHNGNTPLRIRHACTTHCENGRQVEEESRATDKNDDTYEIPQCTECRDACFFAALHDL